MQLPKRASFYISLSAILVYWLYAIMIKPQSAPEAPSNLEDFILLIIKVKLIYLFIIYVLLRVEGLNIMQLGFSREGIGKQILVGLLFGFGIWVFIHILVNPLISSINPIHLNKGTDMSMFMKDIKSILMWIPFVILFGGFIEELQRIFVLTRFQKWFGNPGLYIALGVSSIAFGIGHLYQGLNTAIGTGLGGLLFGLVYLRKRSAVEAITSHAIFDVTSVLVGFMINHH